MVRLSRLVLILALAALLQACQTGLPGRGPDEGVTPNAVTGDAIEVTALDAAPPATDAASAPATDPTAAPAAAEATAAPQTAAPAEAEADPAPAAAADAEPAPEPEAVAAQPKAPKSEAQLACERRRGQWMATGLGSLRTCVFSTRDGGKQCTRSSQCEGVCLARSGTCAPIRPLLGCNEVLQDNGARVTLCVE